MALSRAVLALCITALICTSVSTPIKDTEPLESIDNRLKETLIPAKSAHPRQLSVPDDIEYHGLEDTLLKFHPQKMEQNSQFESNRQEREIPDIPMPMDLHGEADLREKGNRLRYRSELADDNDDRSQFSRRYYNPGQNGEDQVNEENWENWEKPEGYQDSQEFEEEEEAVEDESQQVIRKETGAGGRDDDDEPESPGSDESDESSGSEESGEGFFGSLSNLSQWALTLYVLIFICLVACICAVAGVLMFFCSI